MPYSKDVNKPLTAKMKAYCEEFVANGCHSQQAYRTVFGDGENVRQKANILHRNPRCQEYITYLLDEAWKAAAVTPSRMLKEIAEIAFSPVDNENGLTYGVKKDYFTLLQRQMGLDKQVIDAKVDTVIKVDIEDDEPTSEE